MSTDLLHDDFRELVYSLDPDHWIADESQPIDEDVMTELLLTGSATVKVGSRSFVLSLSYTEVPSDDIPY